MKKLLIAGLIFVIGNIAIANDECALENPIHLMGKVIKHNTFKLKHIEFDGVPTFLRPDHYDPDFDELKLSFARVMCEGSQRKMITADLRVVDQLLAGRIGFKTFYTDFRDCPKGKAKNENGLYQSKSEKIRKQKVDGETRIAHSIVELEIENGFLTKIQIQNPILEIRVGDPYPDGQEWIYVTGEHENLCLTRAGIDRILPL